MKNVGMSLSGLRPPAKGRILAGASLTFFMPRINSASRLLGTLTNRELTIRS